LSQQAHSFEVLTYGPAARQWNDLIEECLGGAPVRYLANRKTQREDYTDVECLVGLNVPGELLEDLPRLRWIQCLSVAVGSLPTDPRLARDVRVTNTAGLYGDAIAEYVVWAMITLFRQFHRVMQNQRKRRWQQVFGERIENKTVGILGLGNVGRNIARMSATLGMQTIGFGRPGAAQGSVEHVREIDGIDNLADRIPELDAVVVCLPLTPQTRQIVDSALLSRMKSTAILINVARGGLIDESAVYDAVASGQIAGAALDVFDKEPLRWWDRRWSSQNILVTPHTSAMTAEYKTRVADLIRQNMVRFAEGKPLINEVDRSRGY
jgi:phosphoglycerate dehydrogenase-like enzyme